MSEKYGHLTVYFDQPLTGEGLEFAVNAILMVKGVNRVDKGSPLDISSATSYMQFRRELGNAICDLVLASSCATKEEKEFIDTVKRASELLRSKRGY